MKYSCVTNTSLHPNKHGVSVKKLYDQKDAQVMHISLMPGESLIPHSTPVDVFFWIVSGTPEILVGEEKEIFQAGVLVESPANIQHCIYNNSDQTAEILVVKTPNPSKL